MATLDDNAQRDLLEILDDRFNRRSTIVTSQLLCGAPHNNCNAESILMQTPLV
jgi:hypothetical protein